MVMRGRPMTTRTRKSLFLTVLLLAGILLSGFFATNVFADETYGWNVTYEGGTKMTDSFSAKRVNEILSGMQPGDTVTFNVDLSNGSGKSVRWYMENKVIQSLEDSAAAAKNAGGAYGYKLSYTDSTGKGTTLFESDTVGGIIYEDENLQGLKEVPNTENTPEDNFFYLYDLGAGKGGSVMLTVSLDGETQGNAYQSTLAEIELRFAVEIPEKTTETKTGKPVKKVIAVATGDGSMPWLFAALAAVSGSILLLSAVRTLKSRKRGEAVPGKRQDGKGGNV